MRIYVIGGEQSGKSTAARFLGKALRLPVAETQSVACRELARFCMTGKHVVQDEYLVKAAIEVMDDRFREGRKYFSELLVGLNPTALVDHCMPPYRPGIVVGVSRFCEVHALMQRSHDHVMSARWIRIERPGHKDADFELESMPCVMVIRNDGSLKGLKVKMERLAEKMMNPAFRIAA